jgi:adenosylmethionine-8-amino-7-oxononanoate aminotransferase
MSDVFHRQTRIDPPVAVRGEGLYIVDAQGRRYLDASGGAAVSCIGHGHPAVVAAIREQAEALAYSHTSFFTSRPAEELGARLVADAPAGLSRVYFTSGGSEAVEAALKMARQYFVEIGQPQRRHVIARWQSYHGNTLGALSAGGNRARREVFAPLLLDVAHIEPCFAYRFRRDDESEAEYGRRVADLLEAEILARGPDTVMAFIAETVVGATAGAVPAVPGYFTRVREICDRYGVLLILDEVMCGMGRTGTRHACEQEGIAPDLLVVAKGLGGGYQPIGAVLVSGTVYDAFARGSGRFQHGHTYLGHPVACAAALAVQKVIDAEGLLARVRVMGARLRAMLADRFGGHRHVGDIRGRGLFLALELVRERASKEPFDPKRALHAAVKREAMARGLLVYPMGGTIDGERGDHVLLAPPFTVAEPDLATIVERLGEAVDAAIAAAP